MRGKKKKSPLFLEKPSGELPKYDKEGDLLLNLNSKMKEKLQELKNKRFF